jgi:hypothetical protein
MERRGGGLVRNEGEAECMRVVEAEGTTLTAHKIGRHGRGRARIITSEASIELRMANVLALRLGLPLLGNVTAKPLSLRLSLALGSDSLQG